MTFKRMIFWAHLIVGVVFGFVILLLSITGVLLTYEHSIINKMEANIRVDHAPNAPSLTIDQLSTLALKNESNTEEILFLFRNNPDAAVIITKNDHEKNAYNPYTGEIIKTGAYKFENTFHYIVRLHRYLAASNENRKKAHAIVAISNLMFVFIIISGLYLWLPKIWKWKFVRTQLLFRKNLPTSKARDYNWHHVFGIWALIPLFFVVTSGVVMSYPWATASIFKAYGEQAPTRRGPPWLQLAYKDAQNDTISTPNLQAIFEKADQYNKNWSYMEMIMQLKPEAENIVILQYTGHKMLPQYRTTLAFNRKTENLTTTQAYQQETPARKTRTYIRFLHTGEVYGLIGQTIAGLASLAACFLVYTGWALAFRRLIMPFIRRRRAKK